MGIFVLVVVTKTKDHVSSSSPRTEVIQLVTLGSGKSKSMMQLSAWQLEKPFLIIITTQASHGKAKKQPGAPLNK